MTVEDDVKTAVAGVDSVVFCASQRKLPLSTIGFSLVKVGSGSAVVATTTAAATIVTTATTAATTQAAFSKSQEAPGGSVEEEGVALVAGAIQRERRLKATSAGGKRRAMPASLVLLSKAAAGGEASGMGGGVELNPMRPGESLLVSSGLEDYAIVQVTSPANEQPAHLGNPPRGTVLSTETHPHSFVRLTLAELSPVYLASPSLPPTPPPPRVS